MLGSIVTLSDCTLSSNFVQLWGGALYVSDASFVTLTACIINGNIASVGPGLYLTLGASGTTIAVRSNCAAGYFKTGTGLVACSINLLTACSPPSFTADLLAENCEACDQSTYSCCGDSQCLASPRTCSSLDTSFCPMFPVPEPTPLPTYTLGPSLAPSEIPAIVVASVAPTTLTASAIAPISPSPSQSPLPSHIPSFLHTDSLTATRRPSSSPTVIPASRVPTLHPTIFVPKNLK